MLQVLFRIVFCFWEVFIFCILTQGHSKLKGEFYNDICVTLGTLQDIWKQLTKFSSIGSSSLFFGWVGRRVCSLKASVVEMVRHTGWGAVSLQRGIITQQFGIKCAQTQTALTLDKVSSHLAKPAQCPDKEQWQTLQNHYNYLMHVFIWMTSKQRMTTKSTKAHLAIWHAYVVPFFKAVGGEWFGYCVSIAKYFVATPRQGELDQEIWPPLPEWNYFREEEVCLCFLWWEMGK